jgi:multisubunit Na+/H+ antiporter MnhE subunit
LTEDIGPRAGSGSPRRRQESLPFARRAGSWLVWWTLLMAFWVWADDSVALAELVVGAVAAALGAFFTELVQYQAATHFRLRIEWIVPALRLPVRLIGDLLVVVGALGRRIARGEDPPSGFRLVPLRYGDDSPEGVTRRVLITAGSSFAPNTFVLGFDEERQVMVVHDLVSPVPAPGR